MSSGKSTLINALLCKKLMPSKNEACTATITKITDNDKDVFRAEVYNKNNELLETHENLTLTDMEKLNSNIEVSIIKVDGNIPFVTAEDVKLVLVDTPGPNNSRNKNHQETTYTLLKNSAKTLVLYVVDASKPSEDSDKSFIDFVAGEMKISGKQSKDRFMFIVNRLDVYKDGEDDVKTSLKNVKEYLEDAGIINPNIYPSAALPALYIRTIETLSNQEKRALDKTIGDYQDPALEMLHLEKYAPLTHNAKKAILEQLEKAKTNQDVNTEALIHTGIIPIELAIRMYVQKYAKTAKIKNIVDTFEKKLESAKSFENTKNEIASNKNKHKEITAQIQTIQKKIDSGENAKSFKDKIDSINIIDKINSTADKIIEDAIGAINKKIAGTSNEKLTLEQANKTCDNFSDFASDTQAKTKVKLEKTLQEFAEKEAKQLLQEYKKRVADLTEEIEVGTIDINTLDIMSGNFGNSQNALDLIKDLTQKEKVEAGEEWIENTDKKWYKPWTWLAEKGHYKTIYENREFILGSKLAEDFFAPIKANMYDNVDKAKEYAEEQTKSIKKAFKEKFDELDSVLKNKLSELQECSTSEEFAKKVLAESEKKLQWLKNIQERVSAILEI